MELWQTQKYKLGLQGTPQLPNHIIFDLIFKFQELKDFSAVVQKRGRRGLW